MKPDRSSEIEAIRKMLCQTERLISHLLKMREKIDMKVEELNRTHRKLRGELI